MCSGSCWPGLPAPQRSFVLRLVLLIFGLLLLIGLVWHIGPARLIDAARGLGSFPLLIMLLPSVLMYGLEAVGWRLTLGLHTDRISFWRLFMIRTAGEVVNMTTPAAYVGGEPLKAYLLKKRGVPMVEGLASVIIAKTTMTIAEVLFILLGIGFALWILGSSESAREVVAASVSVGLLAFVTAALVVVQRYGFFNGLMSVLRNLKIRIAYLEARQDKLLALDRMIRDFYTHNRRGFYASTGIFFLGWLAEAMEVYAILYYLGGPVSLVSAISIGALSVFIKGGTFFIPGSVGAQEGGNLLLLEAFGYSDVTGMTFALLRRLRELVWIGIGILCLTGLGWRNRLATGKNV
jgi:uncharacterized protein (TIRG00374 family)